MSLPTSPISIVTAGDVPISTATTLVRHRGRLHVTVIVKARFAFAPESPVTIAPAPGIVRRDRHYGRSSFRSVGVADDLAPRLPRAQVTLVGHAYAPPGESLLGGTVRLVVAREEVVLDKTLHVLGDVIEGTRRPFQKMRLVYERAAFSDDNPVGIVADVGSPNLVDPAAPEKPAAFGPVSRYLTARRLLLGSLDRGELDRPIPSLPDDFDWSYFQAAPPDQRVDKLSGEEWIVLDGMHPVLPRVCFKLPSAAATARISVGGEETAALDLLLDTVAIDADLQVFDLVWRAVYPLAIEESELGRVAVVAGLTLPSVPVAAPKSEEAPARAEEPSGDRLGRTRPLSREQIEALRRIPIAPFPVAPPGVNTSSAPIPGAPWQTPPSAPRFNAPPLDAPTEALKPFLPTPVTEEIAASAGSVEDAVEATGTGGDAVPIVLPFVAPDLPRAPLPVLAAIPVRTRPAITLVNLAGTTALTIPWQVRPPQSSLTLLVKGTFDLVPDGAAKLREESEVPTGDVPVGKDLEGSVSYPSDLAIFKPRADVTLMGTAHAPSGSAPFMAVTFKLGEEENGFERRLIVFGDRTWRTGLLGDAATQPEPFTALPLIYERAFGGRGFESNPVGTGHRAAVTPGVIARLPNLEDPSHLIMRHDEAPRPVGFGPIPSGWRERRSKLGTYDQRWLRTRWPYFPDDFDWKYFQSAPAEQQLAYLRGDEPYEITGTLADRPSLRGSLPGLRMRGFAQRTAAAGGQLIEVPLQLDTAHFDTDAGTVNLVWRGILEVSDEEAPELAAIGIFGEALMDSPMGLEEAQARLLAALTPLEPVLVEPEIGGEKESEPANDEAESEEASPEEVAATAQLDALLDAQNKKRLEILRAAGIEEEEPKGPPPEPLPPDLLAIAGSLRAAGASEEDIAGLLRALEPENEPAPEEGESSRARARAVALLAESAPFEGEDFGDADLSGLDFSGASLAGGMFDGADLHGCRFEGADLKGAQLGRANLAAAIFDGADLEGADLTSATLTGASFVSANLEGAEFSHVSAVTAIFRRARGDRPSFAGGDFTRADFSEAHLPSADFTAATLDGALFERMIAPEIALFDAVGVGAVLNDAQIPRARADGVCLTGASLRRVVAPTSMWEGAKLDQATFFGAELEGASFNRASCHGTVFSAADLGSAHFLRAHLGEAQLLKADAMMASFRSADLTRADLRGSNLHAADTYGAKMAGSDRELAIVTQSLLTEER